MGGNFRIDAPVGGEGPHDGKRFGGVALVAAADGAFTVHDAAVFGVQFRPSANEGGDEIGTVAARISASAIAVGFKGKGFRHASVGPHARGAEFLGAVHHLVQHTVFHPRRGLAGQRQEQAHVGAANADPRARIAGMDAVPGDEVPVKHFVLHALHTVADGG